MCELYLPIEVQVTIGTLSREAWCAMLAFNEFAEWSMSDLAEGTSKKMFETREGPKYYLTFLEGKFHCYRGEPLVWYSERSIYIAWMKEGRLHRSDDHPALIEYSLPKGRSVKATVQLAKEGIVLGIPIRRRTWFYRGKIHRENGPAMIVGREEHYYRDGFHQRVIDGEDMPEGGMSFSRQQPQEVMSFTVVNTSARLLHRFHERSRTVDKISKRISELKDVKIKCVMCVIGHDVATLLSAMDEPAISHGGFSVWALDGYLHRIGGPAVQMDGKEYYYERGYRMHHDGKKIGKNYYYYLNGKTGGSGNRRMLRGTKINHVGNNLAFGIITYTIFRIPFLSRGKKGETIFRTKRSVYIPFEFKKM